jgi:FkbM family methyltransferase
MLTDFGRGFGDVRALASSLRQAIAAYRIGHERRDGRWMMLLPGRPPYPWRAPKLAFRLNGRRPVARRLHEPVVTAAFDFILDRTDPRAFYDVGAAWGYFSFLAAARADRQIEVHAFDPIPSSLEQVKAMAQSFGFDRVHAHLSGLGRAWKGERDVWISVTKMFETEPDPKHWRDSWSVRMKFLLQGRKDRDLPKKYRITVDSIDAFAARNPPPPGLIKIDIDGFEAEAVPGGMETFRTARPVLILELHRQHFFTRFGTTREEIVQPLFDLGYSGLFLTNFHRPEKNEVIPVAPGHPLIARSETDVILFV